jgi:small neutral amino acid transporter SnatA (MarC family)
MQTLLIVGFLVLIIYNLGAGLYYMMVDKGKSNRTVNSLTRRIALSVALILLVCVGIGTGVIKPHGISPAGDAVLSSK